MKKNEMHVSKGASPFISKADVSLIPNIERRTLEMNVSIFYAPYKARSQYNSGGARSALFLPFLFLFGGAL
jgi:hypothetical protein